MLIRLMLIRMMLIRLMLIRPNILEEETANRIAIKFLVKEDASEKNKFFFASDFFKGWFVKYVPHTLFLLYK